jgi:tRNA G18 (ribose-2'-O)-methylase SpoU
MQNSMINVSKARDCALAESNSCFNVHDHLKGMSVEELKQVSLKDRLPWHTVCLNVTGDLNVGTMIRTSHCLGASSVIIFGRQKIDNRSLVGSANYIHVEKVKDEWNCASPERFHDEMVSRRLVPILVEMGGIPIHKVNWDIRMEAIQLRGHQPCLVMGNETGGIPREIEMICKNIPNSFTISIPQRGVIRSMNVGVAHAIVASTMCEAMDWLND